MKLREESYVQHLTGILVEVFSIYVYIHFEKYKVNQMARPTGGEPELPLSPADPLYLCVLEFFGSVLM